MFAVRRFTPHVRYLSKSVPKKSPLARGIHSAFGKYLLFTNTWTSGVLMMAGDMVQQEIEYQKKLQPKRYDWNRLGQMFLIGLTQGPIHHYFYGYLDKLLPRKTLSVVVQKIMLDQLVMSPICIVEFFYGIGLLEKKSIKECTQELKEKFVEVYTMDWCVWPPTQFINFYFLPVKYQVLYINFVTTVYNVFISYIKFRDTVAVNAPVNDNVSANVKVS